MKFFAALILASLSNNVLSASCTKPSSHPECSPRPFSNGGLTVVNGDGSIIGEAMSIDTTGWNKTDLLSADVRLEYDSHGYILRFYGDDTIGLGFNGKRGSGYWVEAGCIEYPQYFGGRFQAPRLASTGLAPFISEYFTVVALSDGGSLDPRYDIADLSPFLAHLEPYDFEQIDLYGWSLDLNSYSWICTKITLSSGNYTLYSLSDVVDIKSQLSAPISFVPD